MNTTHFDEPHFQLSDNLKAVIIFMYAVIAIIAIGGNGVVCYLVYAYKRMHTVPNYFIVNLACSDIIMAIFCIPLTFVPNILNYWPFGAVMCPALSYIQVVAVFLSAYTLVAMSIDRYIVIVHPFKKRITTKQTAFVIFGIWILSLAIPLPSLLKSRMNYYSNTSGQCLEDWKDTDKRYTYTLAIMILHYFGPLTILLYSYTRVGYTIWVKHLKRGDSNKRRLQLAAAKQRMIKMMITVVIFYALCWLPIHVITLIGDNNPAIYDHIHTPVIWLCSHWLAMSNSCYNPIIYIWMSPKFKAGLQLAFEGCSRRRLSSCDSNEHVPHPGNKFGENKTVLRMNDLRATKQSPKQICYVNNANTRLHLGKLLSADYMLHDSIHSDT